MYEIPAKTETRILVYPKFTELLVGLALILPRLRRRVPLPIYRCQYTRSEDIRYLHLQATDMTKKVHLLDYVAGNIRSLVNAIEKCGYEVEWIKSPEDIKIAEVRMPLRSA